MRFQEIAKELHIQLVVLHDQDGLSHPSLQSFERLPVCGIFRTSTMLPKSQVKIASDSL
jgi:hypothetical protein